MVLLIYVCYFGSHRIPFPNTPPFRVVVAAPSPPPSRGVDATATALASPPSRGLATAPTPPPSRIAVAAPTPSPSQDVDPSSFPGRRYAHYSYFIPTFIQTTYPFYFYSTFICFATYSRYYWWIHKGSCQARLVGGCAAYMLPKASVREAADQRQ